MKNKKIYFLFTAIALLLLAAWIYVKILPSKKTPANHEAMTGMENMDMDTSGLKVVNKESSKSDDLALLTLLQPTNSYAISSIPAITLNKSKLPIEISALGYTAYNTTEVGAISAKISGRIEKLYVKYRYQLIHKGQKIMDIYSPELVTAQQNLIFLLKNDPTNTSFIQSAKEKLLLLGFPADQLQQVINQLMPMSTVAVYSNYSGHIHESGENNMTNAVSEAPSMNEAITISTQELTLKEGMYLQKGRTVFTVYNPNKIWALLNFYPSDQSLIHVGDKVHIVPEARPDRGFYSTIHFIEPFFRPGSKTITARVNMDNSNLELPIGSQLNATVYCIPVTAEWLPKEAILTLGLEKVVFVKSVNGYKTRKITTGIAYNNLIQVKGGITSTDSVAGNAQFLMDSESFIKIHKNE